MPLPVGKSDTALSDEPPKNQSTAPPIATAAPTPNITLAINALLFTRESIENASRWVSEVMRPLESGLSASSF